MVSAFSPSVLAQSDSAKQLTQQGHRYLDQGKPSEAFDAWGRAKELYEKQNNQNGVIGSLVNQSQAQQMLGQYFNACWSLIIALEFDAELCRSQFGEQQSEKLSTSLEKLPIDQISIAALQNLGIVSRELWKHEQAIQILQYAIEQSRSLGYSSNTNNLQLSLANTHQASWRAIRERYRITQEKTTKSSLLGQSLIQGESAFRELESLIGGSGNLAIHAKINWLQFYQQLDEWIATDGERPKLIELRAQVQPTAQTIVADLKAEDLEDHGFSAIEAIYGQIKIADNLLKLYQNQSSISPENNTYLTAASRLTKKSLEQAERIENSRATALSLILLGKLYAQNLQDQEAYRALSRAKNIGISTFASDAVYQASWELAKLNKRLGDREAALKSYENAIAGLEDVRGDLLSLNQSLQLSFREEVEPIYREYLQILMTVSQPDFEKILEVSETLQVITLENFLQCGKLSFKPLKEQPNLPAVFHILDLGDRLEVVIRNDGKLHRFSADAQLVKDNAAGLQEVLQDSSLPEIPPKSFLPFAQALYDAVISPGEALIGKDQRLIVVANGTLNNLPIGMLHDGEKYLLEKYQVSTSLGAHAVLPDNGDTHKPKTIFAGVAGNSPAAEALSLPMLPEVEQEKNFIVDSLGRNRTSSLMDKAFTIEQLKQKLPNYSVLHIATHGKFSSDPSETYLLAWKEQLGVTQLDQIIRQGSTQQSKGLELLFLSACESAKGDGRSQLGLAGLATQAGARNAIASLWLVESQSTSVLAREFYRHLSGGLSHAEALQKAQIKLKNSDEYNHPYHWAPFILLGGL